MVRSRISSVCHVQNGQDNVPITIRHRQTSAIIDSGTTESYIAIISSSDTCFLTTCFPSRVLIQSLTVVLSLIHSMN